MWLSCWCFYRTRWTITNGSRRFSDDAGSLRQHGFVSQLFLLFGSLRQKVRAVHLLRPRTLRGLEEKGSAAAVIHDHDRARIAKAGVVEKIVVFAIVIRLRQRDPCKQHNVATLDVFGQLGAAPSKLLRTSNT